MLRMCNGVKHFFASMYEWKYYTIYGALNEAISLAANGLMRSTQMRNFFLENYLLFAGCRCLL